MIKRFLPLLVLASVSPVPALAGSITMESIRDQDHALLRAKNKVPAGYAVSRSKCSAVQVKDNERYRCTVYYAPDQPLTAQLIPGVQPPMGYQPVPGMQPPAGYPQPGGMQPPMGYQPVPGMQPPMGYPQPAGMQPPMGYQQVPMQQQQQMLMQQQMMQQQMMQQQRSGLTQAQVPAQQTGLR